MLAQFNPAFAGGRAAMPRKRRNPEMTADELLARMRAIAAAESPELVAILDAYAPALKQMAAVVIEKKAREREAAERIVPAHVEPGTVPVEPSVRIPVVPKSAMTPEEAATWVVTAAYELADKPPPGSGAWKDDTGLSAATNAPIRRYVGMVGSISNAPNLPWALHLGAAEYLRVHSETQLNRAEWEAAHAALQAMSPLTPKDAQGFLQGMEDFAPGSKTIGKTTNGSFAWASNGSVKLNMATTTHHSISNKLLEQAGFVKGKDYVWEVAQSYGQKQFFIRVQPHAVDRFRQFLQDEGWGAMALALAATKPTTPTAPSGAGGGVAAPTAPTAPVAAPEPAHDPLPDPLNPEHGYWNVGGSGYTWNWDRNVPQDVFIAFPGQVVADTARSAAPTGAKRAFDGSTYFWRLTVRDIREVINAFKLKNWRNGVALLQALSAMWEAALPKPVAVEECNDRVELSYAPGLAAITDPAVRAQAEAIVSKIRWTPGRRPYSYQEAGIAFVVAAGYRALIADAMGLGKSLQAIGVLLTDLPKTTPAIIVAPAKVVGNWENEIEHWSGGQLHSYVAGSGRLSGPHEGAVLLLSWDTLNDRLNELIAWGAKTVIFDESQYAKNKQAARAEAAIRLATEVPNALLLSGTPMVNRPKELYTQIKMVDPRETLPIWEHLRLLYPKQKSTYSRFVMRYADAKPGRGGRGLDDNGASNLNELRQHMRCIMVRRLKTQPGVIEQLPPKERIDTWVQLGAAEMQTYHSVEASIIPLACEKWKERQLPLLAQSYANALRQGSAPASAIDNVVATINEEIPDYDKSIKLMLISELRRVVGQLKIPTVVNAAMAHLAQVPIQPLVIFVDHKFVSDALTEALRSAGVRWTIVDGKVTGKKATERVAAFQAGQYDVIIGSQALKTGVNLTHAHDMIFAELWWVPGDMQQAEDRIYRLGQKFPSTVRYIMAKGTVDEKVDRMVKAKQKIIEAIFDNEIVDDKAIEAAWDETGGGAEIEEVILASFAAKLAQAKASGKCFIRNEDLSNYLESIAGSSRPTIEAIETALQTKRTNPAIDQVFIDPKNVLAVEHSGNPGHTLILTDQGPVEVPVPLHEVTRTLGIHLVELPTRQGGMVHVAPRAVREVHHDRIVLRDGLILDMSMSQRAVERALG